MTDDPRGGATGAGSLLDRLRRRARSRSVSRSALAAVTGLIAHPPGDLAAVERLTGPLDVDMAGPEGHGAGVFRPESPFAPGGVTGGVRLGRLRPGITRVVVSFAWDPYHGQPRDARLLRPEWISVSVDLDRSDVHARLEQAFGPAREIAGDDRSALEFGQWYYLGPARRPASLDWHARRPDWAVPAPRTGAVEALLASLGAALRQRADPAAIASDLAALCDGTGATVSVSGDRLLISARPGLPLGDVATALGLTNPVAWSPDVHMSTWVVGEDQVQRGPARDIRVGRWAIRMRLERAPSGAPVLDRGGPSRTYDLRGRRDPLAALEAALVPAVDESTPGGRDPARVPAVVPHDGGSAARPPGPAPAAVRPLPWYYAVNDRPVMIVPTPDGGADALVFDWASGGFVPDRSYFGRTSETGVGKDIDSFSKEQFDQLVAVLRRPILARLVAAGLTWEAAGQGEGSYRTTVDGRMLEIRVNDASSAPTYTLLVAGEAIADLDDWPDAWSKPAPPRA